MNNPPPVRSVLWSLAAIGMFAGHAVGYGLVDVSGAPDHGYMSLAVPLATVVAVASLAAFAVRVARRVPSPSIGATRLLAVQAALYATFEIAERLVGGGLLDLLSWPVILGLLAQLPVALLLSVLVRVTVELTERLATDRLNQSSGGTEDLTRLPELPWVGDVVAVPVGRRGPPLVVRT